MSLIQPFLKQANEYIWYRETKTLPLWEQKFIAALRIICLVIRDLFDGQLTLHAMGLVYTTLLSLVPFIAISFSVLKGFGVQNQIEPMLLNFMAPLGEQGKEIVDRIIGFVNNIRVGVLGSVGLVLLIYTAVSLLQKIERSFNYMWRVNEGRSFIQRFSQYLSVILIGPVLVFTALGITASIASYEAIHSLMEIEAVGFVFNAISRMIPYLLVIAAFTFVYLLIPNTKVYFRSALVAGTVAGVLWESAGWVFASFVVNSTKYMAIYTVFASLIIFMIWVYVSWLILLIGCSIAFYFQYPEQRRLQGRAAQLSSRVKEKMAFAIMALVGKLYYQKEPPYNARQVANRLGVASDVCNKIIATLLEAKLLVETSGEPPNLLPAYALDRMPLSEVVNAVRIYGENPLLNPTSIGSPNSVQDIYDKLENGVQRSLEGLMVKDLVDLEGPNVPEPNQQNDVIVRKLNTKAGIESKKGG